MKTILYNGKQVKLTPLLMKSELVAQTLKGLKTQTRRLNGLEEINLNPDKWVSGDGYKFSPDNSIFYFVDKTKELTPQKITCPYGQKGDVIWVREKFKYCQPFGCESLAYMFLDGIIGESVSEDVIYKINDYEKWRPSIHMPFDACRLFLEIVDIRPELLQDITEEDAMGEGIEKNDIPIFYNMYFPVKGKQMTLNPKIAFASLWQSINGRDSWQANPWVWRIEYKEIPKPDGVPG